MLSVLHLLPYVMHNIGNKWGMADSRLDLQLDPRLSGTNVSIWCHVVYTFGRVHHHLLITSYGTTRYIVEGTF